MSFSIPYLDLIKFLYFADTTEKIGGKITGDRVKQRA